MSMIREQTEPNPAACEPQRRGDARYALRIRLDHGVWPPNPGACVVDQRILFHDHEQWVPTPDGCVDHRCRTLHARPAVQQGLTNALSRPPLARRVALVYRVGSERDAVGVEDARIARIA